MKKVMRIMFLLILIPTMYLVSSFTEKEEDTKEKMINTNYSPYKYTEEDYEIIEKQNKLKENGNIADINLAMNFEEINKEAEIILIASPKRHLVEREIKYSTCLDQFGDPVKYQYYHLLDLDIKKVLKGKELISKNTQFAQSGGYDPELNYIHKLFGEDEMSFSQKGYEYIFFFYHGNPENLYFPVGVYQGKINIDGRDKEEALGIMNNDVKDKIFEGEKVSKLSEIAEEKMTLGEQIKVDALKKYEKEIEELGIPIVVDVEVTKDDIVKYENEVNNK